MNAPKASLDQLLGSLPRDIEPSRDLWPAIAAATRRPARRWPLALAAGIVIATIASLLTFQSAQRPDATPSVASRAEPINARFQAPDDARYLAARAALEADFEAGLTLLAPDTQQRIRDSLATIRAANEEIRVALAADPASPMLLKLLARTWQQEIDLYSTVADATLPLKRTT